MKKIIESSKKVWIKTFGCQMNYHDTERILSNLSELNYGLSENIEEADLILFNTCAIRDLANSKFYSSLGEVKALKKRENKSVIIGVGGCVAQIEGNDLIKKYKHLDFAFGTDQIDNINKMVERVQNGDSKFIYDSYDPSQDYSIETKIINKSPQAFVNIIKGCNNFCTYCIVPFSRGREKSRRSSEILSDIKNLIATGVQEVTLLGQNVNAFGKENNERFSDLLIAVNDLVGLKRLRYTTSHPYFISDDLIKAHSTCDKLADHLHLPVQSGSDSVLKRMGRRYTSSHYLEILEKIREANPRIVITSDIIVGFPNETENEFLETISLLEKARFDSIYSYKFSPRPGTAAEKIVDELLMSEKSKRLQTVQKIQEKIQIEIRSSFVGSKATLLVEGAGRMRGVKKWKGRSSCNRLIHFVPPSENDDFLGKWVDVEVLSATPFSCQGSLIGLTY